MSHVTNVILSYPLYERRKTNGPFESINAALLREEEQVFGRDVNDVAQDADTKGGVVGGSKWLEHCIHVAAFNHIGVDALRQTFASYAWQEPQTAQLMICDQHESAFSVETAADIRAGKPRQKVEL